MSLLHCHFTEWDVFALLYFSYPIERMMPSSVGNGPQEEHASQPKEQNGSIQSMYCKDLVFGGDTEFSFEELRAQRYFIQLNEKVLHLNKVKQELRVQIEQKQKLIQGRNGATQHQVRFVISDLPELAIFSMYFDDKLYELYFQMRALESVLFKFDFFFPQDASISRSEEAIINGHWNKTLCRSPDDTCDFARAAQLASTPFGGPVRQNPSEGGLMEDREALNKTASVIFKEPNSDAIAETKKLSPIQEISQEWGYTSFSAVRLESTTGEYRMFTNPKCVSSEPEMVNPCSLAVRKTLLDNVDLSAFTNFNRKTGPLPEANDDLHLDGETLLFVRKMGDADRYLYGSSGGSVLAKVDKSPVPWDFYISCQLRASLPTNLQHCYAESICYLYENGSFTLWRVHQGMTIQDLLEERIDRQEVPLLAVQLLEMVKQMHSCRLVHGALRPDTLISEESVIIGIEFSSSLDLELQPEVKMVQALPSAQDYIKQGLLLPTASPYQVDLVGIAEIVHLLLVGRSINLVKEDAYWRLAEDFNDSYFFHTILNPQDKSTECVLSNLINSLKNALYEDLE
uniref:BUB1 mitotic checkpoint serine/threonine kinase Ba n=1 Tax=Pygocentrus nattereri TaxID=42514 RepID=A0AAR2JNN9_PYGNA